MMSTIVVVVVMNILFLFSFISSAKIDINNGIIFSGVKFKPPISNALQAMQITQPTPIQAAAIAPLTAGTSCILHAETGSGKTLAYLLPMLKRLFSSEEDSGMNAIPFQAVIIVPTKELAVQVAADINTLVHERQEQLSYPLIHLCISTSHRGSDSITSPIIVGTPFKLLDIMKEPSFANKIQAVKYVVFDEVDRMLTVPGRYSPNERLREARKEENPAVELLNLLVTSRGGLEATKIQFIAASATIGRPMRRSLGKFLYAKNTYVDVPVIRPVVAVTANTPSNIARSINNNGDFEEDDDGGVIAGSGSVSRTVGIPMSIRHIILMHDGDELTNKLAAAKEGWSSVDAKRGIVFVPSADDVKQSIGILHFWGVKEAHNLQQTLGISMGKPRRGGGAAERTATSDDLILRATESGVGASSKTKISLKDRELFVIPVSGSRGLHIQNIEYVYILRPPYAMDEYLHMAGRTGRNGAKGTVVTVANLEEMKKMLSWQTPLGIDFEVKYSGIRE